MRLYLLGIALLYVALSCHANPIIITANPEEQSVDAKQADVQSKGEIQEATQGVFKSETKPESETAKTEIQEEKTEEPTTVEAEAAETTTVAVKKAKEGRAHHHKKHHHHKAKEIGRQSSDDDDDEDDDDDDILGDDDDDDDDDTAADEADDDDDDEGGDYFDGFFDDILGGGDDDDDDDDEDDDEDEPSGVVTNTAQLAAAQNAAAAQAASATAQSAENQIQEETPDEQLNAAEEADGENETGTEVVQEDDSNPGSLIEKDPVQEEAIAQNTVQQPIVVDPVPANDSTADDDDDDEEDDDDDDDIGSVIGDDDDDDDDETDDDDDEDDDDDDDDADLADVIDARKARALKNQPKMPQIYISKYNRFVDAVLNRINRLLGKQYDPVRVKLLSQAQRNHSKNKSNSGRGKQKSAGKGKSKTSPEKTHKMGELELGRSDTDRYETVAAPVQGSEPEFVLISKTGSTEGNPDRSNESTEVRASPTKQSNKKKGTGVTTNKKTGNKAKPTKTKTGTKTKQTTSKNKPKARATLFGLSTLKRDGDVTVTMFPDYTTVKTNFVLGPLMLRVERELAKSGKRELRSATATTAEMYGRLNLRLVHGGVATLHSIRVLQPKQVRIDSANNHDKTAEFMWKRSPQIASIVSQKLGAVARSMLKPPPQPRP